MKKIVFVLSIILSLILLVGCNNTNETVSDNILNQEIQNVEQNDNQEVNNELDCEMGDYITLNILPGMSIVRFKMTKDTTFWNTEDDYGAGEIDTIFVMEEDVSKDNYDYTDSYILFGLAENRLFNKGSYNGIPVEVTQIEDDTYSHHIQGETNNEYLECYFVKEDVIEYGYEILLILEKNKFTEEQIERAKQDFKCIIDTFEVVGNWDWE